MTQATCSPLEQARRDGLDPQRVVSGEARMRCPAEGCDDGRRGTDYGASLHVGGDKDGVWQCFRCGASGHLGSGTRAGSSKEEGRPATPPPPPSVPINIQAAWPEVRSLGGEEGLVAWALERGWPEGVAHRFASDPDVAFCPPTRPRGRDAARLWQEATKVDRPVLFAVRDSAGDLRAVQRRSRDRHPEDGYPKSMAGRADLFPCPGGRFFGDLPSWATWTEEVYLTEGEPDWAALRAFLGDGERIRVMATPSCSGLAGLARAALGLVDHRTHVVLLPHLGDTGDVGLRKMTEAGRILAARAGRVELLLIPGTGPRDLAGLLEAEGVDGVRRLLWEGERVEVDGGFGGGDDPPPPPQDPPGDGGVGEGGDGGEEGATWPDSDAGLADRLVGRSGSMLRYVSGLGWLVYDGGGVWRRDSESVGVQRLALESGKALRAEVWEALPGPLDQLPDAEAKRWKARLAFARRAEDAGKVKAAVDVARLNVQLAARVEDLDRNPWQVNTTTSTLDLELGCWWEHAPDDLLTLQTGTAYVHEAPAPSWRQFVLDIMDGDVEMAAFLQRAVGYSLTGSMREQCFFLLWGARSNGKSTFLEVLSAALGDYAKGAQFETFAARASGNGEIRADIATLRGARLVTAVEPDAGVKLAEGLIKQLTGGDPVTARHLYQEPITFRPTFKLWLACNDKPLIRGQDEGMWRRVRLIPFLRQWRTSPHDPPEWPEADRTLKERLLRDELPGVLAWAIEGARAWLRDGLCPPLQVLAATDAYHGEQDTIGAFLDDCCQLGQELHVKASSLYEEFAKWCTDEGLKVWSKPALGAALAKIPGVTPDRIRIAGARTRIWRGLGLSGGLP